MKKRALILALILSLGLSFTSTLKGVRAVDYASENSELKDQNSRDKKSIEDKKHTIENKQAQNNQALEKIQEIGTKIAETSQKISETEIKLNKLKDELVITEKKLEEAKIREAKSRAEMMLRIQYMYENSNTNLLVLFFQLDSFSDFLNSTEYQSQITDYDRKQLNEYLRILEEIKLETEKQKTLVQEQTEVKEALEKDKAESKKLLAKQEELIEANKADINSMNEEIKKLNEEIEARDAQIKANIQKAQEELNRLRRGTGKTSVNISSNTPASSGYIWPLPSSYTTITSPFSYNRRFSPGDFSVGGHRGVDIAAPTGTPIYAVRSGVVVQSGWGTGGTGNMVCIIQDDGYLSRYMHMSSIAASVGTTVSQGEVIGYVGMTGFATGPHLHFQVETDPNSRWGSTAFDPLTLY